MLERQALVMEGVELGLISRMEMGLGLGGPVAEGRAEGWKGDWDMVGGGDVAGEKWWVLVVLVDIGRPLECKSFGV